MLFVSTKVFNVKNPSVVVFEHRSQMIPLDKLARMSDIIVGGECYAVQYYAKESISNPDYIPGQQGSYKTKTVESKSVENELDLTDKERVLPEGQLNGLGIPDSILQEIFSGGQFNQQKLIEIASKHPDLVAKLLKG